MTTRLLTKQYCDIRKDLINPDDIVYHKKNDIFGAYENIKKGIKELKIILSKIQNNNLNKSSGIFNNSNNSNIEQLESEFKTKINIITKALSTYNLKGEFYKNLRKQITIEINELTRQFQNIKQMEYNKKKIIRDRMITYENEYVIDIPDDEFQDHTKWQAKQQTCELRAYSDEIDYNEKLIKERDEELDKLLQDIVLISNIMKEFNEIVHDQSDLINRIDFNIEKTKDNVEEGVTILGTAETISNYTNILYWFKKCCSLKYFLVYIILAAILIIMFLIGLIILKKFIL